MVGEIVSLDPWPALLFRNALGVAKGQYTLQWGQMDAFPLLEAWSGSAQILALLAPSGPCRGCLKEKKPEAGRKAGRLCPVCTAQDRD